MKIPPGACDCHVHVFGPSVEELLALHERLGLERVVIVHPTLDALKRLGKRARGVAVIDKDTPLEGMHEAGVRGVHVDLQTAGVQDTIVAHRLLHEAAARIAPLGWHVQTFARISMLKYMRALPVPLVLDHFGLPRDQDDCEYLVSLLGTGKVYIKLSGAHRVPFDPAPLVRALVAANPERCVWGSDWPHPDPIDDAAALKRLHGWVSNEALFRKILVDNPARLYDFPS